MEIIERTKIWLVCFCCAACSPNLVEQRPLPVLTVAMEELYRGQRGCANPTIRESTGVGAVRSAYNHLAQVRDETVRGVDLRRYSLHLLRTWYPIEQWNETGFRASEDSEFSLQLQNELAQSLYEAAKNYPDPTISNIDPSIVPDDVLIHERCTRFIQAPVFSRDFAFVGLQSFNPHWFGVWIYAFERRDGNWGLLGAWSDPRYRGDLLGPNPFRQLDGSE